MEINLTLKKLVFKLQILIQSKFLILELKIFLI
jgi:hypothetical protein